MICLGNICRSPLAEGILRSLVNPDFVEVASAGTGGWHVGEKPDPRSIAVAQKNGIDISPQRGRKFSPYDFEIYDYIYVMDRANYNDVIALAKNENEKNKVSLILETISPGAQAEVPDPYYGGDQGFNHVFNLLQQACEKIALEIEG